MKWIKASERLPEKKGDYCVKPENGIYSTWQLGGGQPNKINFEWLDESQPESEESQDELWKEVIMNVGGDTEFQHMNFLIKAFKNRFTITKHTDQ